MKPPEPATIEVLLYADRNGQRRLRARWSDQREREFTAGGPVVERFADWLAGVIGTMEAGNG